MNIIEVGCQHPLRNIVEQHIAFIFQLRFNAHVSIFAPRLYASVDESGAVQCAAGVRTADERFHAECYLEGPPEQAISQCLRRPVSRSELLEFTALACTPPGEALGFVSEIVNIGRDRGCNIALFTGTAPLRRLLTRAGLAIFPISRADRTCVADQCAWGRYYDADPWVCVAPDPPCSSQRLSAPCFPSALAKAPKYPQTDFPAAAHA